MTPQFVIKLDLEEAKWLIEFIRNARSEDESISDSIMREELFNNLDKEMKQWLASVTP